MPQVTGILCQVITGKQSGAGTDGRVYLGLGGREFRLDSSQDDYERGSWREYILGQGPNDPPSPPPEIQVQKSEWNDPREGMVIEVSDVVKLPKYIRFEPKGGDDNWNLAFAAALAYAPQFAAAYFAPADFQSLWMGDSSGKILHLTEEYLTEPQMRAAARRITAAVEANRI